MFDRPVRSLARLAPAAAATLSIVAIAPASASTPSTITFHFFSKTQSFSITTPAGKPVSGNTPPAPGDVVEAFDLNYVGNHKHHAKHWTATDHLRCVITTVTMTSFKGVCDGQVAIGGSMLLADHVIGTFTRSTTKIPINRGTGVYRGYHGLATSKSIALTNNSDFTITVKR